MILVVNFLVNIVVNFLMVIYFNRVAESYKLCK